MYSRGKVGDRRSRLVKRQKKNKKRALHPEIRMHSFFLSERSECIRS
jgi:hypothetical protein